MKKYILAIIILLLTKYSLCQQDQAAREILDRVAEKSISYKSIQADYELIIEDHKEDLQTESTGRIIIKGNKYKLESAESTIYYDGKTMWTYTKENEEVVISEPDSLDENLLSNPAKIFNLYSSDFKYRYDGEIMVNNIKMHEIHLFPKNLDQPYSRIKLYIDVNKDLLSAIKIVGKDGIDYNISLGNYITDEDFNDSVFTFDGSRHKKAEIIDLR